MYMKGLCENVKGAWDWLFHEHISRRIMAVFVIFFLISFFLTYSLYSWAARKQEDSMIEQSSVQMVTGVRNNLDELVKRRHPGCGEPSSQAGGQKNI